MRRWRLWTDDGGSASLEFIAVGVLLLVPLIWLVVALGSVQSRALGVEAGARHAARAIATASNADDAGTRAARVLGAIADEYGLDPDELDLRVQCAPAGRTCPAAGALLTVELSSIVTLPLVPAILGLDRHARIPVTATSVQKVSQHWQDAP
ncbi:TadE/TadG family type IV pilus assembly protein [Microbacterium sp. No. 7]|uniref:TadE/TadG family type IV pilus assembly protein n=1 Tax=Microbacterium sp. No. 7 TaxID=1714373 RepID=UPI0006D270D1|nr:hypothetical protein [Microbacterium sp. No. 7]ALJ20009.1 TadE family protein [Microbacterium sp. No. 7]